MEDFFVKGVVHIRIGVSFEVTYFKAALGSEFSEFFLGVRTIKRRDVVAISGHRPEHIVYKSWSDLRKQHRIVPKIRGFNVENSALFEDSAKFANGFIWAFKVFEQPSAGDYIDAIVFQWQRVTARAGAIGDVGIPRERFLIDINSH